MSWANASKFYSQQLWRKHDSSQILEINPKIARSPTEKYSFFFFKAAVLTRAGHPSVYGRPELNRQHWNSEIKTENVKGYVKTLGPLNPAASESNEPSLHPSRALLPGEREVTRCNKAQFYRHFPRKMLSERRAALSPIICWDLGQC